MFYAREGRPVTSCLTDGGRGPAEPAGGPDEPRAISRRPPGREEAYFGGRRVQVHSSPTVFPSFGPSMRAWSAPASSIQ